MMLDEETRSALRMRLRAEGWGWLDRSSESVWGARFLLRLARALEAPHGSERYAAIAFSDALEDAALAGAIVPMTARARGHLDRLRRLVAKERRAMMRA